MTWISNPSPVAEPGMWHLRTETEGYMEFVHRRTGEVVCVTLDNPTTPIPASKCNSRPGCPCESRHARSSQRGAPNATHKTSQHASSLMRICESKIRDSGRSS